MQSALDAALMTFWRHGYEGTSLAMLADATGLNMPSLYAAFGNKESLFHQALERYIQTHASYLRKAVAQPTARGVAKEALRGAIRMVMRDGNPDGCLLVHGALASGPECDAIRRELSQCRGAAEMMVRRRFERAKAEGDLPRDAKPGQLARYLMTVIWGLSVQAAGGASESELKSVAAMALRNWPNNEFLSAVDAARRR